MKYENVQIAEDGHKSLAYYTHGMQYPLNREKTVQTVRKLYT